MQSFSQTTPWKISARVVSGSNTPIPTATVSITDTAGKMLQQSVTDSNGSFKLISSLQGIFIIQASHTGYQVFRSEKIRSADKDFGVISLAVATNHLAEVTVTSKQNVVELDGGTLVYNVAKSISAQGTNAFEVLKKTPGVYIDNNQSISVNGKEGVMILLDGKQTYLSSAELADLLRSMPSSSIRSIEVITSPPAKYDAAGGAGILNIRTNKSLVKGFNGSITTGFVQGITPKQNEDISLSYRRNKINVYGGYNHFLGNYTYAYGSDRIQRNKVYNSYTDDTDKRQKMSARLGFDYSPDKNQTVGVLVNGNFLFGGGITDTKTAIRAQTSPGTEQTLEAVNDYYHQKTERYMVNVNYKYEDSLGRLLNIDIDNGSFTKGNANLQSNIYRDNTGNTLSGNLYRSLNEIDIRLFAVKIDHATNIGKGKLETGMKYSSVRTDNDARFFHLTVTGDSVDEKRTNTFRFTEKITSGYTNYKIGFGKWVVQAGLRLENAASEGYLQFKQNGADSTKKITRDFTNLFPSASISFKPKEAHAFSFAYSRRIDRPAYQDLNPFIYLLDELSYWQGNPFLQPQLTHRATIQYAYKNSTIVSLTYAHTDEFSAKITDTLELSKIVMVPRNLGVQKHISLTVTQFLSPAKGWDINFNGTFYQLHNIISFDQYRNFDLSQLAARLNLQQTVKLPYGITGELTGLYVSGRLTGANETSKHITQFDLGLQRSVLKNKGTIRVVFADIFKGNQSVSTQQYTGFYVRSYGYYESRQLRVNFTYKFADKSGKTPRARNSALENENSRIK